METWAEGHVALSFKHQVGCILPEEDQAIRQRLVQLLQHFPKAVMHAFLNMEEELRHIPDAMMHD